MPLVIDSDLSEEAAVGPRHELARQINPSYAQGPLVRVAWAANQAEAEMIQGMLLSEGVPSLLRRTRGFDVPDMLAAGARDVLVPQSAEEIARGMLGPRNEVGARTQRVSKWVFLATATAVGLVALAIVFVLYALTR
ncbi:hypothetical protein HJD18_05185 [Thermoleophilia bacterium SCSIO 60948]|nr:hypothetical protein HJD18_05185 [Thermoleophilia bacterium SCSIO 60948]